MVDFPDYELIDFGQGRKLERFGSEILNRPESTAFDMEKKDSKIWKSAHHIFKETDANKGIWTPDTDLQWKINLKVKNRKLELNLSKGKYKHIGVFPEQLTHWRLIEKQLNKGKSMLNLFAYTGVSSLVGAATGASVTHIDSSKSIMKVARENAAENNIDTIRFIQEDALKFAERELKRKRFYNLIICDPPVFGMGVKREKWKLDKDLPKLIQTLSKITLPEGILILNTYSPRVSVNDMRELITDWGFRIQDSGWLEIQTKLGYNLRLSKYIVGRRSASA